MIRDILLIVLILLALFAPVFNCHTINTSSNTSVKECQTLFGIVRNYVYKQSVDNYIIK
jgi:hypothetical protein